MARSPSRTAIPEAPMARAAAASGRRSLVLSLILSLRPAQWTKNLIVFAGLVFSLKLFEAAAILTSIEAFVIFCALSGLVYLMNDVMDRDSDRRHPTKSQRPIASGDLPVPVAIWAAAVIAAIALTGSFMLGWRFGAIAAGYVILQALYSGPLKHVVIIDVLSIAIGFVLRAIAGAVVLNVVISHWLFVCTILLALFMALAKRRHELVLLADDATSHRPILGEYSAYLLDQMIAVVTASTLIAYIFYTISPETEQKFGTSWLGLTIPFPLYGIFRYLYLVHKRELGGSPADLLLNDRPLLACVTFWVLAVVLIIYHPFVP
jgi:4-hydroxybenzoate polyprenyltransferase